MVSIADAQTLALNFYKATTNTNSSSISVNLNFTQSENDGTLDFYVFNIAPAPGFVIVSAADNVTPVLGYSTESNFNSNIPQIGIGGWMTHTAAKVHQAVLQNITASAATVALRTAYMSGINPSSLRSSTVAPMLATTWAQDPLYNQLCPYDSTNNGQCVTGCVATAMAQIMKFWSYPAQGTGSFTYVDSQSNHGYWYNIGRLSADFGATTYQWSQMPLSLSDQNQDVAQLMYQCGVSVAMNYSAHGSSAYVQYGGNPCAMNSFTAYFGYDATTIQYVQKSNYTDANWQTLIVNELNAGRPVLYSGQDTGNIGGHAWVCDGYDVNGNLHMNWGWGGMDNGYFLTSDLDPGAENWSWSDVAIIGIKPGAVTTSSINTVAPDMEYTLYPNPASSNISIKGNNTNARVDYIIYDIVGNRILQGSFAENSTSINVSGFTPDIYLAKLQSGEKQTTLRFVVEK
jgi:hypothetical protein